MNKHMNINHETKRKIKIELLFIKQNTIKPQQISNKKLFT